MGFIFAPERKCAGAGAAAGDHERDTKRELEHALPFAMEPVVYDFAINEHGTFADLLAGDEALMPRGLLRADRAAAAAAGIDARCRRCAAPNSITSAPPAARSPNCAAWCKRSSTGCCRVRQGGAASQATLDSAAGGKWLRSRAARADSRRPAKWPHRPRAESTAAERGDRGCAARRRDGVATLASGALTAEQKRWRERGARGVARG